MTPGELRTRSFHRGTLSVMARQLEPYAHNGSVARSRRDATTWALEATDDPNQSDPDAVHVETLRDWADDLETAARAGSLGDHSRRQIITLRASTIRWALEQVAKP